VTIVSPINYGRAQAAGLPIFRLMLSNWGNEGVSADANSLTYGGAASELLGSAFVVAVAPNSTVDKAIIAYQFVPLVASAPSQQQNIGVGVPLSFITGPVQVNAGGGRFTDTYFRDGDTNLYPFGGAEALFERPELDLDFYLRAPVAAVPLKRSPLVRRTGAAMTDGGGPTPAEQLVHFYPFMGRHRGVVSFRATGTAVATVRVGMITTGVTVPIVPPIEATAATGTVDATTGAQAMVELTGPAEYVSIYYTLTAGAGDLVVDVYAYDDGGVGVVNLT
jgi:hypothetical protein